MDNPREFLGLGDNASLNEIKKAYRKYAGKLHPDKHGGDPFFEELFKRVSDAYESLSNPKYRQSRDRGSSTNANKAELQSLLQRIGDLEKELKIAQTSLQHKEAEIREIKTWAENEIASINNSKAIKINKGCIRNIIIICVMLIIYLLISIII